jgi:hypothetical protein
VKKNTEKCVLEHMQISEKYMLQGIRITYRIRANQGVKYETWSISSYNNVYEAEITMLGTDTKHKTKANKKKK